MGNNRLAVIMLLGSTQTLAWASSYYLPAILADPIAEDLGMSSTWFFAAFSAALVISALVGPRAGRTVDAIGGREVLAFSNVIIAAGLALLSFAHSQPTLWAAWLVLGVGMGIGLYDTAFAALGRIYGLEARSAITGITLVAGFASTVGWPLSAWGASALGWRETCMAWAAAHIVLGLPLNLLLPKPATVATSRDDNGKAHVALDRTMIILGLAFAASWMVVAAMAVHLPRMLEAAGATTVQAVAAGALIGPSQVGARILEASLLRRFHPMVSARISVALHPIGAGILAVFGAAAASAPFTVLHGAGSGILTIARGSVPLAMFGPDNYGYRLGLLGAPSRVAMAAAPLLFGILIDWYGAGVLVFSSALSLAALMGLCKLRMSRTTPSR
ncbi:MFS transporter [Bradyrhizobium sp.]|uniref:MFS transporter n=1 Tax=Bradyrhizobium sp. TaxID=376 RepID=UPI002D53AB54|nr:MFS transporter [Bradyrhizobium sp.]HZR74294.1 MFS transporter [Bradyrhizobium sp.]